MSNDTDGSPDVVVDVETMSLRKDAAIVSIAAVAFDSAAGFDTTGHSYTGVYVVVSLASSVLAGLHVDDKTVGWWRDADPRARGEIESGPSVPVGAALARVFEFIGPGRRVWGHGSSFDVAVLEQSAAILGIRVPWSYRDVRDTRTLFWIAEERGWVNPLRLWKTAHVAAIDALAEALAVQSARLFLRTGEQTDHGTFESIVADCTITPETQAGVSKGEPDPS